MTGLAILRNTSIGGSALPSTLAELEEAFVRVHALWLRNPGADETTLSLHPEVVKVSEVDRKARSVVTRSVTVAGRPLESGPLGSGPSRT